jgi:phosphotransferase system  glucose/maltose/N-acetylglucosamine-specific IIC component
MMKFFQRLGKALMLPVACLPVCGILMGIGYILAPAAMAGEVQGFTAGGFSYSIGLFLIKAGGALIDNMSWLIGITFPETGAKISFFSAPPKNFFNALNICLFSFLCSDPL